jgi:hypothetical protein
MSKTTSTRVLSYACLLLGLGLIVHALLPRGEVQATANAEQQQTPTWQDTCSQQTVKLGTQTIETIQVGQRVISDDPTRVATVARQPWWLSHKSFHATSSQSGTADEP